jgi:sugar lactone lactonase YvrE
MLRRPTPDADRPFDRPQDIIVDEDNGRALVVDTALKAVIAVDLITGTRSVLSSNTSISGNMTSGGGIPFDQATRIVLDSANSRALVTDTGLAAIIAVDLATGDRTVLSNSNTPDGTTPFGRPDGIALDPPNNRALVADLNLDAVIAVDLTTGARTLLSDDTTPDARNRFDDPVDVLVDTINNRILVVDEDFESVIALHPDSGERVDFSR